MSEFLIVRLSRNSSHSVQWLVWSEAQQDVIASGELNNQDDLAELTTYAAGRQAVLLISAADVLLAEVDVPAGASRQFESMLPYLLEDDIAQDVDDLHFSVLEKRGDKAKICAVETQWLSETLTALKDLNVDVKRVLPDALALPELDGIAAVELDGQWLMKKDAFSALSVHSEWLEMVAQSEWVKQDEEFLTLTSYSPLPELNLAEEQTWQTSEPKLVMQLLAEQAVKSKVNLLSGRFKPKSSLLRHWKVWQKAVVAAAVFVVIAGGYNLLKIQQYETQANAYRAESERIFRTVLPGKNKIPTVSYLKRQLTDEASKLSGGGSGEGVLNWMVKLPQALSGIKGLKLNSFKYDQNRGEVRLEAQSQDFQSFEKAREQLAQHFAVEQGQLNRSGNAVNGTFVLKNK
ncbi:type II secretion system protein GspL [Vibrio sp. TRT 17S01]|uniref:type II secretion system protein GspL n=1 Tax=Vibrio sp. TRT 17S01 TaxID=3418505 RepID=UPI003CF5FACD